MLCTKSLEVIRNSRSALSAVNRPSAAMCSLNSSCKGCCCQQLPRMQWRRTGQVSQALDSQTLGVPHQVQSCG